MIKNRSEALHKFKEFEAWLDRDTGVLIERVHSDNAKEYDGMNKYLEAQGIVHTYSTACTPQSNGCTERYNRTVLDKVRSMLEESGLPTRFWVEAVLRAAPMHNVRVSAVLDNKTSLEVLFGYRPDVSCIRLFGCAAYVHIPKEIRDAKFVHSSTPGTLLRHGNGLYKVLIMTNRTMSLSKHVLVDETIYPDKKESQCSAGKKIEEHDSSDGELEVDLCPLASSAAELPLPDDDSVAEVEATRAPSYPARRRPESDRYAAHAARLSPSSDEPTLSEALKSSNAPQWREGTRPELEALKASGTWELVERPLGKKVIYCK